MRVQVQKWGNSLALRIPKPFADEIHVNESAMVDLTLEKGKLTITPVRGRRVKLRDLLSGIHAGNLHGEVDAGPRRGRESW